MKTKSNLIVVVSCSLISLFFLVLCFAMVPLYNKLCRSTGFNGKVDLTAASSTTNQAINLHHAINMQFVTTTNQNLSWEFHPEKNTLNIYPEQNVKMYFYVKNNTKHTMTVQAIPSITPWQAAKHLHKIECFCFRQQTLLAGQSLRMPVIFRIDKNIGDEINTVTLAYTLFDVTPKKSTATKVKG